MPFTEEEAKDIVELFVESTMKRLTHLEHVEKDVLAHALLVAIEILQKFTTYGVKGQI